MIPMFGFDRTLRGIRLVFEQLAHISDQRTGHQVITVHVQFIAIMVDQQVMDTRRHFGAGTDMFQEADVESLDQ
ncbi:hypothetical protein BMS3Bbin04_01958 [bacterium BMS3Bbin04]|nr:hypothetical protein BMS3Bbin04_01958 [bacterium BMS3Bbin04]